MAVQKVYAVSDMMDVYEEYYDINEAVNAAILQAADWIRFNPDARFMIRHNENRDILFFENVAADRTPDASVFGLEYDGSPVGIHVFIQRRP